MSRPISELFHKCTLFKRAIDGVDVESTFADLEPTFEDEPVEEDESINEDERDQSKYNELMTRETPSAFESFSEELSDQVYKAIGEIRKKIDAGTYTPKEALKDIESMGVIHEELSELQENTVDHDERTEIIDLKKDLENMARMLHTSYVQKKAAKYKSNLFKLAALDYFGILALDDGGLVLATETLPLLNKDNKPFSAAEIKQLKRWIGAEVGVKGIKDKGSLRVNLMDIHPINEGVIKPKVLDPSKADPPVAEPVEQEDELAGLITRIQVSLSKITERIIKGDYESKDAVIKSLNGLEQLYEEIPKWFEKYPAERGKRQREVVAVMAKLNIFLNNKFSSTAGYRSDLFKQAFGVG